MQPLRAYGRVEKGLLLIEPRQVLSMEVGPASLDLLRQWWEFVGFVPVPRSLDLAAPPVSPEQVLLRVSGTHASLVCLLPAGDIEVSVEHGDVDWSGQVLAARVAVVLICEGVLPELSDALLKSAASAGGLLAASVGVAPA